MELKPAQCSSTKCLDLVININCVSQVNKRISISMAITKCQFFYGMGLGSQNAQQPSINTVNKEMGVSLKLTLTISEQIQMR